MKKVIMAVLLTATSSTALAYDFNGDLNPKCADRIMQYVPQVVQENANDSTLQRLTPAIEDTFIQSTGSGDGTYLLWVARVPFRKGAFNVMTMEIGVRVKNETHAACRFQIDSEVSVVNAAGGHLGGGGGWGE